MTKLCPMRFREFADDSQQVCIGGDCAWFGDCCKESNAQTVTASKVDDSREKLEADVTSKLNGMLYFAQVDEFVELVIGWLDRQAAITEREYFHRCCENHVDYDEEYKPAIDELQAKIGKLERENASLRGRYKSVSRQLHEIGALANGYTLVDGDGEVVS